MSRRRRSCHSLGRLHARPLGEASRVGGKELLINRGSVHTVGRPPRTGW